MVPPYTGSTHVGSITLQSLKTGSTRVPVGTLAHIRVGTYPSASTGEVKEEYRKVPTVYNLYSYSVPEYNFTGMHTIVPGGIFVLVPVCIQLYRSPVTIVTVQWYAYPGTICSRY